MLSSATRKSGVDHDELREALSRLASENHIPDALRAAALRQITRIQLGIFKEES